MEGGVNSTVNTAMNAGVSISESTHDPLFGPIISYTEAFASLVCNPDINLLQFITPAQCATLPLVGSEMGFLPFSQVSDFFFSGHKDPLSDSLGLLNQIWKNTPSLRARICWFLE